MLSTPIFRDERCVRYRYRYSECNHCAEACPHDAVRLHDAGIEIDSALCQNCALCAVVCPTEALSEKSITTPALFDISAGKKQLAIACAPSEARGDAIVPCLGAVGAETLAAFSRQGVTVEFAGAEHCAECAHASKGVDLMRGHVAARNALVGTIGNEQWASLTWRDDKNRTAVGHQASRRHLFRRLVGRGLDQVVQAGEEIPPPPLKAIRAAAPFLPERKVTLNQLVTDGAAEIHVPRRLGLPAEDWTLAPGCTACEACVRVCPTGALQLFENSCQWQLVFLNERCVACNVCAEVCQPHVLQPGDEEQIGLAPRAPRLLHNLPKQRCSRCDRVFAGGDGSQVCPICAGDDLDFASIFG